MCNDLERKLGNMLIGKMRLVWRHGYFEDSKDDSFLEWPVKSGHIPYAIEYPDDWGVIITCDRGLGGRGGNEKAYAYAYAIHALELIPHCPRNIAFLDAGSYSPEQAEVLRDASIAVLYDETGLTPHDTVIEPGTFDYKEGEGTVVFKGKIPDRIKTYLENRERLLVNRSLRSIWNDVFYLGCDDAFWGLRDLDLGAMVKAITFGKEELSPSPVSGTPDLPGWAWDVLANMEFEEELSPEDAPETPLSRYEDILRIWHGRLNQAGLEHSEPEWSNLLVSSLPKIGRGLEIDQDIEAYYSGVPVEDILAA